MILETAIDRFLGSLRAENRSPNTLRAYTRDLKDFAATIGARRELGSIQPVQVRDHFRVLLDGGLARASLVRKHDALRSFYRWAAAEEYVSENIIAGMPMRRKPAEIPFVPTETQVGLLFQPEVLAKVLHPERAAVMLELMYSCGLRISEVVSLNVADLNLENYSALINGKGRKQRYAIFGATTRQALEKYLPLREKLQRGASERDNRALLVGRRGRLTVRQVFRIVCEAAEKAGLPKDLHPHSLRHACATHMVNNGANISALQSLLGHERISTTQRYAHLSLTKVFEAYRNAHPHERSKQAS